MVMKMQCIMGYSYTQKPHLTNLSNKELKIPVYRYYSRKMICSNHTRARSLFILKAQSSGFEFEYDRKPFFI